MYNMIVVLFLQLEHHYFNKRPNNLIAVLFLGLTNAYFTMERIVSEYCLFYFIVWVIRSDHNLMNFFPVWTNKFIRSLRRHISYFYVGTQKE